MVQPLINGDLINGDLINGDLINGDNTDKPLTACSVAENMEKAKKMHDLSEEAIIESAISSDEDICPVKEGDPDYHARRIQHQFKQRIRDFKKKEMKNMTLKD